MAASTDESVRTSAEDRKWQKRTLPFMIAAFLAIGIVFFAATIMHFRTMQAWLQYAPPDVPAALQEFERAAGGKVDKDYRQWYGRVLLEAHALNQRYRQNAAVVYSRVWNGYMGFLTGMALALCGCVFILGKLREGVNFSGEASSAKWQLVTSSPGVVLALAGAALVALSLKLNVKVESEDRPVYLPQLVEIAEDTGVAPALAAPPHELDSGSLPTGKEATGIKRDLPPGLSAKLRPDAQESAPPASPRQ